MGVPLLKHNQEAYRNICRMIYEEGKQRVAVVQPTGSGKSYLILKLVEDCTDKDRDIIVIEPQKYIFDELKKKMNKYGLSSDNVKFITYSTLGKLDDDKIQQFRNPCLVIVDEMHRSGAAKWNVGLQKMFDVFPKDCKYIGLSATPIRYLDKKRNMAEELFNGCMANELSLADAIIQRILPLPRYIAGLYDCSNDVNALIKKIQNSYNSDEEKEELLEEVRIMKRNLDKSKGVSSIFKKYIDEDKGKYIAFCRNITHLEQMKVCLAEWFSEAGITVNLYDVHCKNPEKDMQFQAFKSDDGLAVCLCVAMLAEGIHGVDGVILLRDTISANLYYQQIGRAFAVGMETIPLIIDLVANCESITDCSLKNDLLDAIEKRDKKKMEDGNGNKEGLDGEGKEITKEDIESFFIFDQVLDAINAFKSIEGRLEGDWENGLKYFDKYVREHNGDVLVPRNYKDKDGFCTGIWVSNKRNEFKNEELLEDRIAELNKRGFVWNVLKYNFLTRIKDIKKFVDGNGRMPSSISEDKYEKSLGNFIIKERMTKKELNEKYPDWKEKAMKSIVGFVWNPRESYFLLGCKHYEEYIKKNGRISIPKDYKTEDGFKLDSWVSSQKNKYRRNELSDSEMDALNRIGFVFSVNNDNFDKNYELLKEYMAVNNCDSNIPQTTVYKGEKLGEFVSRMRYMYKNNSMSDYRKEKLQSIGFIWNVKEKIWNDYLLKLYEFKKTNEHFRIPKRDIGNKSLYEWVSTQKSMYKKGKLSTERIRKLKDIGYDIEKQASQNKKENK